MKPPNPELMTQWQSWFAHCSWPSRITGAIRDAQEATAREVARLEALRTRAASCVFCIVHEAPYRAGTGYLAAENVRRYNATGDPFCYYVVPRTDARQTEGFRWHNDVPVIVCAPEGLQDLVTRYQPKVVEFHHTKGWAPDVLGVRVPGEKHLYLHDSMLWCWRVWSFDGRDVCNEPGPEKCRECAGVPAERTVARDESLRRVLPEFQRIIANSDYTAHHARLQLNVPVEVQLPNPPLRTRPFRGKKIGYFGRFDPIKGVHILLEAATKMPEAQFLFFCDKPLPDLFDGRVPHGFENVLFLGGYNQNELPQLVNLIDVGVVPSINESYGLVARELRALGVTVVATATGGLDGTVPPGDADALVEALRRALAA